MLDYKPDYLDKKQFNEEDLRHLVADLTSENGCPWDSKQTLGSMNDCLLEEAAETIDAISLYQKTGNADALKEELGDLLFQVYLHTQIANKEGLFSMDDVVDTIMQKMIFRHPHVYQNEEDCSDTKKWEEIKKIEQMNKTYTESQEHKKHRKRLVEMFLHFLSKK